MSICVFRLYFFYDSLYFKVHIHFSLASLSRKTLQKELAVKTPHSLLSVLISTPSVKWKIKNYSFDQYSPEKTREVQLVSWLVRLVGSWKLAEPPEFGRKWGTECLNTRFPLPTLQCAGYSVKLKKMVWNIIRACKLHGFPSIFMGFHHPDQPYRPKYILLNNF